MAASAPRCCDANALRAAGVFVSMSVGGTSTAIALVTMVPLQAGGFVSDGGRLLRLWRGGVEGEHDAAPQALVGASQLMV